jgi:hypothetical protein
MEEETSNLNLEIMEEDLNALPSLVVLHVD